MPSLTPAQKAANAALLLAASKGQKDAMEKALSEGASCDFQDPKGFNAAMKAGARGHVDCLELALSNTENPNAANLHGMTVVMLCASNNEAACLQCAINAKCDFNQLNDFDDTTALMLAVRWGAKEAADCLLEQDDIKVHLQDINSWTAVDYAMKRKDVEMADKLRKVAADKGQFIPVARRRRARGTPRPRPAINPPLRRYRTVPRPRTATPKPASSAATPPPPPTSGGSSMASMGLKGMPHSKSRRMPHRYMDYELGGDMPGERSAEERANALDLSSLPPSLQALYKVCQVCIQRQGVDVDLTARENLEEELKKAARLVRSEAAQDTVKVCQEKVATLQRRVKMATKKQLPTPEEYEAYLSEAVKARDAMMESQIVKLREVLDWVQAGEGDKDVGIAALEDVISQWQRWQGTRPTVDAAVMKLDKALEKVAGLQGNFDEKERAIVARRQDQRNNKISEDELAKLEVAWEVVNGEMREAKAAVREAEQLLNDLLPGHPELGARLTGGYQMPPGLKLLQATHLLKERSLDDYERLNRVPVPALNTVLHMRYKPTGAEKALKAVQLNHLKAIQSEVIIPCRLRHQNLMPVELVFQEKEHLYVQTQWCNHGHLGQWLDAQPRSVREVAAMACGVLHGLLYLHNQDIIHGDIKPANILIADDQRPCISDWGLCRRRSGLTTVRGPSQVGFTKEYAAPELTKPKPDFTSPASDMFAMGKVLQDLLTGMAAPKDDDAQGNALAAAIRKLADQCCLDDKALRPTTQQVQASIIYRQPSVAQAQKATDDHNGLAESLEMLQEHYTWEVQQDDHSWLRMRPRDAKIVERKYLQFLSAGATMATKHDAHAAKVAKAAGVVESKGDDGGPTGHGGVRPVGEASTVNLHDGRIIRFQDMTCHAAGTVVAVRRKQADVYPYPDGWQQYTGDFLTVHLTKDHEEFKTAAKALKADIPTAEVDSVIRVQNKWLWERYAHHKKFMESRAGATPESSNELWLWHGTSATPSMTLCCGWDGVDFRRSDGGFYGRGAYFAERPTYSDVGYAHREPPGDDGVTYKQLIFARVLCGKPAVLKKPQRDLKVPPEGFDSVLAGPHIPRFGTEADQSKMRVVYDGACVYPAFIVRYHKIY